MLKTYNKYKKRKNGGAQTLPVPAADHATIYCPCLDVEF